MQIDVSQIKVDAGTQVRAAISESVVSEYAERMGEGVRFPPVVLFHDGNHYYLADGFHRVMASQRIGLAEIAADVRTGTKQDALWFALGANRANGQRMNEADKRHAIRLAVAEWPDRSSTQIATQVGCSTQYVQRIRPAEVATSGNPVPRRIGADGRSYPASQSAREIQRVKATELLRAGKSVADVRKEVGIGRDTASQIRRELGGLDKSRHGVKDRRERMREMAATGHTSRQIAATLGLSEDGCRRALREEGIEVHADRSVKGTKRHDSNRIVERIVMDAENLTEGVALIDFDDIERGRLPEWLRSLGESREKLSGFIRRLMKEQQKNGEAA